MLTPFRFRQGISQAKPWDNASTPLPSACSYLRAVSRKYTIQDNLPSFGLLGTVGALSCVIVNR